MAHDYAQDGERPRKLLRRLREERGVLQSQLAEQVGLSQPRIAEYESGRREIRALELFKIIEALGLSMRTFWRRWHTASFEDEDDP